MIEAIFAAHELNQKVIAFIETIVAECGKAKHEYTSCAVPEELFEAIKEIVPPAEMKKQSLQMTNRQEKKISVSLQKNWKRHLQRTKNGWQC